MNPIVRSYERRPFPPPIWFHAWDLEGLEFQGQRGKSQWGKDHPELISIDPIRESIARLDAPPLEFGIWDHHWVPRINALKRRERVVTLGVKLAPNTPPNVSVTWVTLFSG